MNFQELVKTDEYWRESLENALWAIKNKKLKEKDFIENIIKDKNILIEQYS